MSEKDMEPKKPQSEKDNSVAGSRQQSFRMVLWAVAGCYLIYSTVGMVRGLIDGSISSKGERIAIIIASVLFTFCAIFLLVQSIRMAIAHFRSSISSLQKASEDEEDVETDTEDEAAEQTLIEAQSEDDEDARRKQDEEA